MKYLPLKHKIRCLLVFMVAASFANVLSREEAKATNKTGTKNYFISIMNMSPKARKKFIRQLKSKKQKITPRPASRNALKTPLSNGMMGGPHYFDPKTKQLLSGDNPDGATYLTDNFMDSVALHVKYPEDKKFILLGPKPNEKGLRELFNDHRLPISIQEKGTLRQMQSGGAYRVISVNGKLRLYPIINSMRWDGDVRINNRTGLLQIYNKKPGAKGLWQNAPQITSPTTYFQNLWNENHKSSSKE